MVCAWVLFGLAYLLALTTDLEIPLPGVAALAGAPLVVGTLAAGWVWGGGGQGHDLVVDARGRTVTLPATFGRAQPESMPLREVAAVVVRTEQHRPWWSRFDLSYGAPHLRRPDGTVEQLARWRDPRRGVQFGRWLSRLLSSVAENGRAAEVPAAERGLRRGS
jgi:hypothetical protein